MVVRLKDMALEEFLELPEKEPALEFEDGRLSQKVSPQGQHGRLQGGLLRLIDNYAIPRNVAMTFPEVRTTFGGRSLVPDLSVYRWSRLPLNAAGKIANKFNQPPDLIIEIVSPEQRSTALVRRCLWFTTHGVAIALLIDPADESVLSFRPNQSPVSLSSSDRIELDEVLPEFALTVQNVFGLLWPL